MKQSFAACTAILCACFALIAQDLIAQDQGLNVKLMDSPRVGRDAKAFQPDFDGSQGAYSGQHESDLTGFLTAVRLSAVSPAAVRFWVMQDVHDVARKNLAITEMMCYEPRQ